VKVISINGTPGGRNPLIIRLFVKSASSSIKGAIEAMKCHKTNNLVVKRTGSGSDTEYDFLPLKFAASAWGVEVETVFGLSHF
jgi:hypothetical protein